jgi:hypothetical protein
LEDNIIATLNKISYLDDEKANILIEELNLFWKKTQDTWSDEYW